MVTIMTLLYNNYGHTNVVNPVKCWLSYLSRPIYYGYTTTMVAIYYGYIPTNVTIFTMLIQLL